MQQMLKDTHRSDQLRAFTHDYFLINGNQGDINDDMDGESGIMPVQLPLSFHAVRMNEKQTECATMLDDMKGAVYTFVYFQLGSACG